MASGGIQHGELRESRDRKMTERGLQYQTDVKFKERQKLMNLMDRQSGELNMILSQTTEQGTVKSAYTKWLSTYELLLDKNEELLKLLNPEAVEEDVTSFEHSVRRYRDLKKLCEHWFLTNSDRPDDVTKHPPNDQDEIGSVHSRTSVCSSTSSQLSAARLKESQRKAELLARASALEEKRQLEEDQLNLRIKQEAFDINTEIKVSDAKARALDDLEKSLGFDEDYNSCSPNGRRRTIQKSYGNTLAKEIAPPTNETQRDDPCLNLSYVSRELNKPKAEIIQFNGNPMNYKRFIRQFESRVCMNTSSYDERINFLLQFTGGEPHKIALGYSNLDAKKGYYATLEEFQERYGDSDLIAQTYVKKALDWPIIKDGTKGLDEFGIFLRECQFAVENVKGMNVLEYSENLKSIVKKLPFFLHDRWRNIVHSHRSKGEIVKFEHLVAFVRNEAKKATDPVYGKDIISVSNSNKQSKPFGKLKKTFATNIKCANEQKPISDTCSFCQEPHNLVSCNKIVNQSLKERYSFLKSKGLCFGCLRSGHLKGDCKNKSVCKHCNYPHPTILHLDRQHCDNTNSTVQSKSFVAHTGAGTQGHQALPIVPVRLKYKGSNKFIETYAFLDSGSTATFCTERVTQLLNIRGRKAKINLLTMGQESVQSTYEISGLEISSLNGQSVIDLPMVYTRTTLPVSRKDVTSLKDIQCWPHLKGVPMETIEGEVDLLIGINVPKAMEPWEVIPSENNGPFAVRTILGWVINGPLDVKGGSTSRMITSNYIKASPTLEEQVLNYFNNDFNERTINDKPEISRDDRHFLDSASESVSLKDGHYTIGLPFKSKHVHMPNNKRQAEQRLNLLAKRFEKDINFREKYIEFMEKVIAKGYAQQVSNEVITDDGRVWYLPHHGVYHPKKKKIRVVFDCAARYKGTSLNDQLLQGPNLTNTLLGTLTRFRQEEVAIMGDIESMFYQVKVSPNDRSFQRFLWWENKNYTGQPVEYQMNVHLFGSTSSPSCANYALRQTALDLQGDFNDKTINTVLRNFYVDDCLKSVQTAHEGISLVKDLQLILSKGGFHISKWVSNNREVMNSISPSERAEGLKDLDFDRDSLPIERSLGVNWCTESDTFSFTVAVKEHSHTRRGILSTISSIYDPLGFLAPMTLSAKVLLQELCRLQLGWDDPIPEKLSEQWKQWLQDINHLSNFKVDRCFKPPGFGEVKTAELHHFADASEKGYGVVTYIRLVNTEERVHCSFVIGKSRVAPLKTVTVPRLELTAATVAVRTDKMLKDELDLEIDRTIFWSDSMTVLRYINNSSSRFHTFVANRLAVIHEASLPTDWHYINTKLNPADIASRGIPVNKRLWLKSWIEAPEFLRSTADNWPETPSQIHETVQNDPEVKRVKVVASTIETSDLESCGINKLLHRHSSWYKLKKSIAWILKVRDELCRRVRNRHIPASRDKSTTQIGRITVADMANAEKAILAFIQRDYFNKEIDTLKRNLAAKRSSNIRKLDPVWKDGLLRVGGRLRNSHMPAANKHPVILPRDHHVSVLILQQIHNDLKHAGRNHMLASLRQNYWLIKAPSAIRKMISKCVQCRRQRASVGEQKMSDLPIDRVTPDEPPFTRVGVDYFGPFEVKVKRSHVKRYGVIFTCLASRAVHLEVAFSLDTDSYINALRRFIARRGQVSKMRSDNGTNFVGAERELKGSIREWNIKTISEAMLQRNVDWQFNPPAGSHHGGVWERLIRSVRSAMNSTLREQVLDDEGLNTLMCEIEAILNDRPITKTSDTCNDLEALTPNHILQQKHIPNLPPGVFDKNDNYVRRRWRQVQYMANLFWHRWTREYLPTLQERQKWHKKKRNLNIGDIVLIVDSCAPRNSWPLAVVKETMQDRLGFVRQVKLKTATNTLIRPIDKLCLILEME